MTTLMQGFGTLYLHVEGGQHYYPIIGYAHRPLAGEELTPIVMGGNNRPIILTPNPSGSGYTCFGPDSVCSIEVTWKPSNVSGFRSDPPPGPVYCDPRQP